MTQSRIPVYFMPGMAANPSIFKNIELPKDLYDIFLLEWFIPTGNMCLEDYAKVMVKGIAHENPILIGVSFGGIMVQEMAKLISTRKIVIISSVKLSNELPKRMLFAKYTKIHKLLPFGLVNNVELIAKYAFGEHVKKRIKLYEEFLSIRDPHYISWALDKMVNWNQKKYASNLVHIHGEKDPVFPISHIEDCIRVKNGTHAMIVYRYRWFNKHLPEIMAATL
ncbi:alpha/beta hydrolase [Flavobacteriaceae bacterium F89]|uniref:Alpha/beta hydrolase n=1 Tax=Cerina litoralis TaxID=2874477 RepID=A0AAE3EYG2_9FLAO|nr:alpha/beta hydrolase [Cerina litoralis]MCG2462022.1 alpha/beta hydrolase [Cerina litoralis]